MDIKSNKKKSLHKLPLISLVFSEHTNMVNFTHYELVSVIFLLTPNT